jgi:hypothetical protein
LCVRVAGGFQEQQFDCAAGVGPDPEDAGREDAGVVENQEITRPQECRKIRDPAVFPRA